VGETELTPVASLFGGVLVGMAVVLMMAGTGRVAGISGIVSRLLPPRVAGDVMERVAFIVGLVVAPLVFIFSTGQSVEQFISSNVVLLVLAGVLVGFGSVWGNGCTSGHGVCGMARLSKRSITATVVFTLAGMIAVFIVRHVIGGL